MGKGSTEDKMTLKLAHGLVYCDKAGGEEEKAMELGKTVYRFQIAANKNNSENSNSENLNQKFSKETFHTYNTT